MSILWHTIRTQCHKQCHTHDPSWCTSNTVWEQFRVSSRRTLLSNSLHNPLLLAEWTAVVLLDPQWHTTVVKRVVALTPDNCSQIYKNSHTSWRKMKWNISHSFFTPRIACFMHKANITYQHYFAVIQNQCCWSANFFNIFNAFLIHVQCASNTLIYASLFCRSCRWTNELVVVSQNHDSNDETATKTIFNYLNIIGS